jgi:hypothetical protein
MGIRKLSKASTNYGYKVSNSLEQTAVPTTVKTPNIDVLVVAGGGGGGWNNAGGGGAGGLIDRKGFLVTPGTAYTVTVGNGGSYISNGATVSYAGTGGDSVFGELTAKGGGGGNSWTHASTGQAGGSGAGASGNPNVRALYGNQTQRGQTGDSGTYGYGNRGGSGGYAVNDVGGGGGGGAGGSGQPAKGIGYADYNNNASLGGNGGLGYTSSITGSEVVYAAGGGGGSGGTGSGPWTGEPQGGIGGGGALGLQSSHGGDASVGFGGAGNGGSYARNQRGGSATANTGSGGGGGDNTDGGNGGSGVVIIAYPDKYPAPAAISGTYNSPTRTGYRVYRFTGSGSVTF